MAEGIDALVLDVKTGDGAFMKAFEDVEGAGRDHGRDRARHGQEGRGAHHRHGPAARPHGRATRSRWSSAIETLKGRGPKDLESLSIELAAWMLLPGRRRASASTPRARACATRSQSGAGLRKFQEVIELQGGDPRVCDDTLAAAARARETVELARRARRTRGAASPAARVGHAGDAPGRRPRDGRQP